MVKAGIAWNAKQIAKMAEKGTLTFDNALQRGFVWDNARMSLLIDSMLRDYPVPPFYTIKTEAEGGKTYDCIDGKQRCTTISRYRHNEFGLGELDSFCLEDGEEIDISGMRYGELPEELKDKFDSYTLTVFFFSDIEDYEIREMMNRLNNGKSINNYEKARIKANDLEAVTRIAKHPLFIENLSEKAIQRYVNEHLVVSSMILLTEEDPSLENKSIQPFMENVSIDPELEDRLDHIFDRIKDIHDYLEEIGFHSVAKKLVTRTHLVSIVPLVDRSIQEDRSLPDTMDVLKRFFSGKPSISGDYNSCSAYGSGKARSVRIRLMALEQAYFSKFDAQELREA
ncbi:MAG: DUF262 domain-containing protein [Lachnospiraceae bacterium]|nr:DUF262 domain-containing protein [Lachnospiraceae bacterium]